MTVDGASRPLEYNNPNGLMEFTIEPGQHLVELRFQDTPVRTWATRLSVLSPFSIAIGLDIQ